MITKVREPHYVIPMFGRIYLDYIEEVTYFLWVFPIHRERIYDD